MVGVVPAASLGGMSHPNIPINCDQVWFWWCWWWGYELYADILFQALVLVAHSPAARTDFLRAMPAPKCPDKKESELRMCCQPRRCAALCHPFGHHLLWPFCRDLLAREGVCMDGGKPPPGSQNWSTGVWHGQERTWRHLLYVEHSHYALASTAPQLGESMNPKSDKWEQMMRSTRKKL